MPLSETSKDIASIFERRVAKAPPEFVRRAFKTEKRIHLSLWTWNGILIAAIGERAFQKQCAEFDERFGTPLPALISSKNEFSAFRVEGRRFVISDTVMAGAPSLLQLAPGASVFLAAVGMEKMGPTRNLNYFIRGAFVKRPSQIPSENELLADFDFALAQLFSGYVSRVANEANR